MVHWSPLCLVSFLIVAVLAVGLLSGCNTVGTGKAFLVRHHLHAADPIAETYFPPLVTRNSTTEPIDLRSGKPTSAAKFEAFRDAQKHVTSISDLTHFSLNVRDRTTIPPFLPADVDVHKALVEVYKKDLDLLSSASERDVIEENLTALLTDVPDLVPRTTIHHTDDQGRQAFFYYPRIQIDFSSRLAAPSPFDRFSYLAVLIRLDDATFFQRDEDGRHPRILNLRPKEADFVEYSGGTLTQNAHLTAKAGLGRTATRSSSNKTTTDDSESSAGRERVGTAGIDGTFVLSDTFVKELKSALERRTVTVLEDGRTLLVELRANEEQRIGGTYSFDLIFEVPATIESANAVYTAKPVTEELVADVRFVGVVRQVARRGFRGFFLKVPEPANDRTYERVVLEAGEPVELWRHRGVKWTGRETARPVRIEVHTNRSDAHYQVRNAAGDILAFGTGVHQEWALTGIELPETLTLEFSPIVLVDGTQSTELIAPPVEITLDDPPPTAPHRASGTYAPKGDTP